MPRITLIRHGHAAAGFGEDMDPGLDAAGHAQAEAVAAKIQEIGPLPVLSSPLRRCRETAAPLAKLWSKTPIIAPAVAEIPSPKGVSLEDRVGWLRTLMAGSWTDVPDDLQAWRAACVAAVAALKEDTVAFSHYVAINVLMSAATGDDRVVCFSPAYCSTTVFDNAGGKLKLVEKGEEASLTKVN